MEASILKRRRPPDDKEQSEDDNVLENGSKLARSGEDDTPSDDKEQSEDDNVLENDSKLARSGEDDTPSDDKEQKEVERVLERVVDRVLENDSKLARSGEDDTEQEDPALENFEPNQHFSLRNVEQRKWKKGPAEQRSFNIEFTKEIETNCPLTRQLLLNKVLETAFQSIVAQAPSNSKAQIFLVNKKLQKRCISTYRAKPSELHFDHVAERLSMAIQSDESITLQETTFTLSFFTPIRVGVRRRNIKTRHEYNIDTWAASRRCLDDPLARRGKQIPMELRNMCFPLVLAKQLYVWEHPEMSLKQMTNYCKTTKCQERAKHLVRDAGLSLEDAPFALEQLSYFEQALPHGVGVHVYEACTPPLLRIGSTDRHTINVFIKYNDADANDGPTYHAYGINSMPAFMGTRKFCHSCFKGHRNFQHRCSAAACSLCQYVKCENTETERKDTLPYSCDSCNLSFPTTKCCAAHECGERIRCKLCAQVTRKTDFANHPCGVPYCSRCVMNHSPLEHCYVQKSTQNPKRRPTVVWYADTETQVHPDTQEHQANLVVLQRYDNSQTFQYTGSRAMAEFTTACMVKDSHFRNGIVVFHNAAGFDAHLWYKALIEAKSPPKSIIRKGQKIISMELAQNGIKCRDSLQFLPGTPLSAFPNMFGLESGAKGDFPHGLNTPEWVQWGKSIVYREMVNGEEHRFPLLKYFWPEKKHVESLGALKTWHKEMVAKFKADPLLIYCPEEELLRYCKMDVQLLREGFETYRKTWTKQYPGLEPLDSLTFPAYNNRIFRDVYMPKDSLCLLPPLGYDVKNRLYSVTAMAWIAWMERDLGLRNVRTARKGFEVKISGHNMDGTGLDANGDLHILQLHGCWYHGHDCQKKRSEILDAWRERTLAMDEHMEQLSDNPLSPYGKFTYHRIYECEFRAQVADNPTMKAFTKDYLKQFSREPLRLRESLRGGRTNAIKHRIVPVPDGWILYYDDYTSLYPAVNFGINGEVYPIGHPEIYIGKDLELAPPQTKDWFGFASVVLLPPKDLLHPVLGQSIGGKLLFHLCTTCAENLQQGPCSHSDKEREIKGTFFTGEISLAISKGYKLIWTQELWHWPPEQRSPDLFRGLILDQYAKKALSSPIPKDPEEFRRLLDEYKDTMGLDLKEEDFKENKAMRALAKFSLNNIWGFLGKRNDMEETEFVNSFARFFELQNDDSIEITRTEITDDEETILVTFKPLHEEASRNGNIALAAMTTAYARMALYKVIDQYSEHVVYMDTDSLFLLLPPGVEPPPTSTVLGGLKDEIYEEFGAGARITKFASIGPKSYTYSVARDGQLLKEVVKMKGISFNSDASSIVTPAAMRNLQPGGEKLQAPQHLIRKDLFKTRMWNSQIDKQVRFQSRKRWFKPAPNDLLDTLPYGFV